VVLTPSGSDRDHRDSQAGDRHLRHKSVTEAVAWDGLSLDRGIVGFKGRSI